MDTKFIDFLKTLPSDKLSALAKAPAKGKATVSPVQLVLDKFGVLGWERLLARLTTENVQALAGHLSVEIAAAEKREVLIKTVSSHVSNKTKESLDSLQGDLLQVIWTDLNIEGDADTDILELELFIGGMEALISLWTVPQLNSVIEHYQIPSRKLKLKEEVVFDVVKSILDQSYTKPVEEEQKVATEQNITPTSPLRPQSTRQHRSFAHRGKIAVQDSENAENVAAELSSAVATMKLQEVPTDTPSRGRRRAHA